MTGRASACETSPGCASAPRPWLAGAGTGMTAIPNSRFHGSQPIRSSSSWERRSGACPKTSSQSARLTPRGAGRLVCAAGSPTSTMRSTTRSPGRSSFATQATREPLFRSSSRAGRSEPLPELERFRTDLGCGTEILTVPVGRLHESGATDPPDDSGVATMHCYNEFSEDGSIVAIDQQLLFRSSDQVCTHLSRQSGRQERRGILRTLRTPPRDPSPRRRPLPQRTPDPHRR